VEFLQCQGARLIPNPNPNPNPNCEEVCGKETYTWGRRGALPAAWNEHWASMACICMEVCAPG